MVFIYSVFISWNRTVQESFERHTCAVEGGEDIKVCMSSEVLHLCPEQYRASSTRLTSQCSQKRLAARCHWCLLRRHCCPSSSVTNDVLEQSLLIQTQAPALSRRIANSRVPESGLEVSCPFSCLPRSGTICIAISGLSSWNCACLSMCIIRSCSSSVSCAVVCRGLLASTR